MSLLHIIVKPADGVSVPASNGIVFVDAAYMRVIAASASSKVGDTAKAIQDTVRTALSPTLQGTIALTDPVASAPVDLLFLAPNGSVRYVQTVVPGADGNATATLDAAAIASITRKDPQPQPSPLQLTRRAYFVPVNDQLVPYDTCRLQIAPIRTGDGNWSSLGLDKVFLGDVPVTTSVTWSGAPPPGVGAVQWVACHVGVDGSFGFAVPQGAGDAWVWWLSGSFGALGVVIDDLDEARVTAVPVALPAFTVLPSAATDTTDRVPVGGSEAEVANNPGVYSEDPGEFCRPFRNPERVLGERSFFVILRAEQPVISSEASVRQDPLPVLTYQPVNAKSALTAAATVTGETGAGTTTHSTPAASAAQPVLGAISDDAAQASFVRHVLPAAYVDLLNRFDRGRTALDAGHPIQWESDVSRYQAVTAARGHILELRMRWRSNGYSLGTVAKTLTLAPRQTRRIQKIEWQRSELSQRQESTQLSDQVSDTLTRDRDYDDSVQANLSEWSRGSSSSSSEAASVGIGFAGSGFVIGGGGAASNANSASSQDGGRRVSASEDQRLRDSIRRYGDALRKLDSLVVNEVDQTETVTGTTEVLRNANYGHSLTVIYYQILRHLKIDTHVAGVRECLFVPFAVSPFTLPRAYRWRDFILKSLRDRSYAGAIRYLRDVLTNFSNSDIPAGRRSDQPVRYVYGSIYIKLAIDRPRDKDDGSFDAATWLAVQPFLAEPALGIFAALKARDESARDALFQQQQAPTIAAGWANTLVLDSNGVPLPADFTLATRYVFNGVVRVDFSATAPASVTRETLAALRLRAGRNLAPGSIANFQRVTFTYQTDQFQRTVTASQGASDLIDVETGVPDANGATVHTIPDAWERRNVRAEMTSATQSLIEHLNEHVEYYHKAIWWNMDRDRLFMMIDGFFVPGANRVSIASVVERDPIAIIGNSIVFRVSAGSFLGLGDITTPQQLLDHYIDLEAPEDPMLVSLPTDGLYAQTVMDECPGLEEHFGNTDWVLNDPDPSLGEIAPELLSSRATTPVGTTPTPLPQTIINLQNAPDAPAPSGLSGVLSSVTNPNAFRDMAGLAGTQANAASAMQTAANLASTFGSQAAALKLAELAKDAHSAQTADQKLATVQRAADKQLVTPEAAQQHASSILDSLHAPTPALPHQDPVLSQAILAASGQPGSTISAATPQGEVSISLASDITAKTGPAGPSAFPPTIADPLTTDPAFTKAFTDSLAAIKADARFSSSSPLDDLPIAIVAIDDPNRPVVGQNHKTKEYYSGSMLKVAAMYAAFQLRHAANKFASTLTMATTPHDTDVFAAFRKSFDAGIKNGSTLISTGSPTTPQYEKIFDASNDGTNWSVAFSADFANHLRNMVVDSHNPSAGVCIQRLGYAMINGLMEKAGFFKPASRLGVWLAGDYLYTQGYINAEKAKNDAHNADPGNPAKKAGDPDALEELALGISGLAIIRIPSVNDDGVGQATTCLDMARMVTLMHDVALVDKTMPNTILGDTANMEMMGLLQDAVTSTGAPSLLDRTAHPGFSILNCKIGVGDLKSVNGGNKVYSEVLVGRQAGGKKREFVCVWQNVKLGILNGDAAHDGAIAAAWKLELDRIVALITSTMDKFP